MNAYLADLSVSIPLNINKPSRGIHVLLEHKCVILRVHHALGDGISLMSLFLAICRKASESEAMPTLVTGGRIGGRIGEGRETAGWESVSFGSSKDGLV